MTNIESMDYTHRHLSAFCQPLLYHALPLLTLSCGANFAGASKPCDMICYFTHKPPYIFLKKATIPTYHGISIAIPRYIAMLFPPPPFDLSIHCRIALHDHIADIVVVGQPQYIILYMLRQIIAHPGSKMYSYRVIFCSSIKL